jgi:hypothetical protein
MNNAVGNFLQKESVGLKSFSNFSADFSADHLKIAANGRHGGSCGRGIFVQSRLNPICLHFSLSALWLSLSRARNKNSERGVRGGKSLPGRVLRPKRLNFPITIEESHKTEAASGEVPGFWTMREFIRGWPDLLANASWALASRP